MDCYNLDRNTLGGQYKRVEPGKRQTDGSKNQAGEKEGENFSVESRLIFHMYEELFVKQPITWEQSMEAAEQLNPSFKIRSCN